jgi:hypothetical protein
MQTKTLAESQRHRGMGVVEWSRRFAVLTQEADRFN